jgi:hypothetical protein
MLVLRRLVLYLRLTTTYRKMALLDEATNKATNIDLILAKGSITTLIVGTTELRL